MGDVLLQQEGIHVAQAVEQADDLENVQTIVMVIRNLFVEIFTVFANCTVLAITTEVGAWLGRGSAAGHEEGGGEVGGAVQRPPARQRHVAHHPLPGLLLQHQTETHANVTFCLITTISSPGRSASGLPAGDPGVGLAVPGQPQRQLRPGPPRQPGE